MTKIRQRNIKKEIDSLTSLIKKDQAFYDTLDKKDSPVSRLLFNRMERSKEKIKSLKASC
jgi:hypothetical protein